MCVLTIITGVWLRAIVVVNFINGAWLTVRAVAEINTWCFKRESKILFPRQK